MSDTDTDRDLINLEARDQLFQGIIDSQRNEYPNDQPVMAIPHIEKDNLRKSSYAVGEIFYQRSDGTTDHRTLKADSIDLLHSRIKSIYEEYGMVWVEPENSEKTLVMKVKIEFEANRYFDPTKFDTDEEHSYTGYSQEQGEQLYTEFKNKFKQLHKSICERYNVAGRISFGKQWAASSQTVTKSVSRYHPQHSHHHQQQHSSSSESSSRKNTQSKQEQLCSEQRKSIKIRNQCQREKKKHLYQGTIEHLHQAKCSTRCTFKYNDNGEVELISIEVTAKLKS